MQLLETHTPGKVVRWLGLIAFYLAVQSLVNEYLIENVLPPTTSIWVVPFLDLFSVNTEQSIPTWYATLLLFVSAVLLAVITAVKYPIHDPHTHFWAGLSLIFLYLSIDEGAVIHELFSTPLETTLNTSGYLTFAWLIAFIPLLLIFALLYLRFLFHLPPRIRNLFILAGLFYVGGAVIVEAISANRYATGGGVTFLYLAIATVEELLEMWGVVLFIFALLCYMVQAGITAVISSPSAFSAHTTGVLPLPTGRFKRLNLIVVAVLLVCNSAVITWAYRQQAAPMEAVDTPFYQLVGEQFEDQGVVILGINEVMAADNPAAPPLAAALLVLFDDVMVVTLPTAQVSVAFASSGLPFTTATLAQLAQQSGETDFTILDTPALRTIAAPTNTP